MSAAFTVRRAQWREQASRDSRLSGNHFRLLYVIGEHFNAKTGEAWPSQQRLATLIGLSERQVRYLLRDLIDAGYLEINKPGKREANRYRIPAQWSIDRAAAHCRSSDRVTGNSAHSDRQPTASGDRQSTAAKPSLSEPSLKNTPRRTDLGSIKNKNTGIEEEPSFPAFWSAYPRHEGEAQARREYAKALKLVSPAELLIGAQRYAIQRSGEEPKYTKRAGNWLRDECWTEFDLRSDPNQDDRRALGELQGHLLIWRQNIAGIEYRYVPAETVEHLERHIGDEGLRQRVMALLTRLKTTTKADEANDAEREWRSVPALLERGKQALAKQAADAEERKRRREKRER